MIDAVDTVSAKIALVEAAFAAGVPIGVVHGRGQQTRSDGVSGGGHLRDLGRSGLPGVMRRELRRRGIPSLKVVYSTEPPLVPAG